MPRQADAVAFIATAVRRRVPARAVSDLLAALDEGRPFPERVALARFWGIYLHKIDSSTPEPPPVEEMTPEKLRSYVEKLVEKLADLVSIYEEQIGT